MSHDGSKIDLACNPKISRATKDRRNSRLSLLEMRECRFQIGLIAHVRDLNKPSSVREQGAGSPAGCVGWHLLA